MSDPTNPNEQVPSSTDVPPPPPEEAPPVENQPPPASSTPPPAAAPASEAEFRTWAMLTHLSGAVLSFLGPIIVWAIKQNEMPGLQPHYKAALNFQITVAIAYAICLVLTVVIIGGFLLPLVAIGALIFSILAGVRANEGQLYKYPLSIEFIK